MKIQTVECLTHADYLAYVASRLEAAHTVSKSGGRRGGQEIVAAGYGMMPQALANVMNGYARPPRKMLEKDGVEEARVYVRRGELIAVTPSNFPALLESRAG